MAYPLALALSFGSVWVGFDFIREFWTNLTFGHRIGGTKKFDRVGLIADPDFASAHTAKVSSFFLDEFLEAVTG